MLRMIGVKVADPVPVKFGGIEFELWPQVVWSPLFAMTLDDLEVRQGREGIGPRGGRRELFEEGEERLRRGRLPQPVDQNHEQA